MRPSFKKIITAFCLLFTGTLSSVEAQSGTQKFEVYAHRGFRGLRPENTIGAMKNALIKGAILEFDLNITKDKKVIVCHDAVLNPKITLGPDGAPIEGDKKLAFYQTSYDQVRGYDVGSKANPDFPEQSRYKAYIPLFAELLDSTETFASEKRLPAPRYFIETKLNEKTDGMNHPGPEEFVDLMMQVVKQKGIQKRMIIQSFDPRTLQVLRKKYPEVKVAFLAKAGTSLDDNLKWLGFNPEYYSANAEFIDEALVRACAGLNIKLITGNCNDYQQILRIAKLGVNRLISDYPPEWLSKRPPE